MNERDVLFLERQRVSLRTLVSSVLHEPGVLTGYTRMTTVVTPRFLNVHKGPAQYNTWSIRDVVASEPVYKTSDVGKREGLRTARYTMRGDEGVVVTLADGKTFLIGSRRPQELHAAIHRARSEEPLYRERTRPSTRGPR